MATTTPITPLPPAPSRADGPMLFNQNADPFIAAMPPMVTQINDRLTWIGEQVTAGEGYKNAAVNSANAAADSAVTANNAKQAAQKAVTDAGNAGAQQVQLAKDQITLVIAAKNETAAIAHAAGVAGGLPTQRTPFTALQVNAAGLVAWGPGIPNIALSKIGQAVIRGGSGEVMWGDTLQLGDLLITSRVIPLGGDYVLVDTIYSKNSYPALAEILGLVPRGYTASNKTGLNQNLNGVAYGNGIFVAVGSSGFSISPTGEVWTNLAFGSGTSWGSAGIAFGAGLFVVFTNNTSQFATSPDGMNWTMRNAPSNLFSVVYAKGQFVAVGYGNAVATSPDGINWTPRNIQVSSTAWTNIAYGAGLYVACDSGPSGYISTSPDGITWTMRNQVVGAGITSIAYGNGRFVLLNSNSLQGAVSENGVDWKSSFPPTSTGSSYVAFGGGVFLVVQFNSLNAFTSEDGLNWNPIKLTVAGSWNRPTFGISRFVVAGGNGTAAIVAPYSYDPNTQFATPKVATPLNMRAYIKAKVS